MCCFGGAAWVDLLWSGHRLLFRGHFNGSIECSCVTITMWNTYTADITSSLCTGFVVQFKVCPHLYLYLLVYFLVFVGLIDMWKGQRQTSSDVQVRTYIWPVIFVALNYYKVAL